MKRIIIALAALFTIATTSMAQTDNTRRERPSKEEMAKQRTEAMAQQYELNADQQAKLLELNTKYAEKLPPMFMRRHHGPRPGGVRPEGVAPDNNVQRAPRMEMNQDFEQKRKEMKESQEAYDNELKEIMTEEQFKKYQEESQKMRRGPREHHGPRGNHGPRPDMRR